jgi:hypothetical protein
MGNVGDVDYADVPSARKNAATDDACGNTPAFSAARAKAKSHRSLRTEGLTA